MTQTTKPVATSCCPAWARWLLVVLWMAIIYRFSDQPNSSQATAQVFGAFNFIVRKSAHVTEFAILFLLSRFAISSALTTSPDQTTPLVHLSKQSILALIIAISYAGLDEWHQASVPGRSASFGDVCIDAIEPILVAALFMVSDATVAFRKRSPS